MSKIKSILAFAALMLCGGAWAATGEATAYTGDYAKWNWTTIYSWRGNHTNFESGQIAKLNADLTDGAAENVSWTQWCAAKSLVKPQFVLRLDKGDYAANRKAIYATYSPWNIGGLIVETGATGYTLERGGNSPNNRGVVIGDMDGEHEAYVEIKEDFSINRSSTESTKTYHNGFVGTVNVTVVENKTFTFGDSSHTGSDHEIYIRENGALKMHGEGKMKVYPSLTATGSVTLDFSDLSLNRAQPFIDGGLTVDESTGFAFPAGLDAGVAYTLCSGTLTAPTIEVPTTITVGDVAKKVRLTYNTANKSVTYEMDETAYWSPNTAKKDTDGIIDWTADDAWIIDEVAGTTATWPKDGTGANLTVKLDAAKIGGVKITGAVSVKEVIVECSDKDNHPFEFHNHTKGVEKDSETGKDPTTDKSVDCLTASVVNMGTYKGNLGLKVPIVGTINFGENTHLIFKTGTAEGEASQAYDYTIIGNATAIEVDGDGKFLIPSTMYGVPFAPNANAKIVFDVADGEKAASAVISGSGSVIKAGAGTIKFTAANTYSGGTVITAGTVKTSIKANLVGKSYSIAADGVLEFAPTGTVDFGGDNLRAITGTGAIKLSGSNWIALPTAANNMFASTLEVINATSGGILLGSNTTFTIGPMSGNGALRYDSGAWGVGTAGARELKIIQSKDTTWSGNILSQGNSTRELNIHVTSTTGSTFTRTGQCADAKARFTVDTGATLQLEHNDSGNGNIVFLNGGTLKTTGCGDAHGKIVKSITLEKDSSFEWTSGGTATGIFGVGMGGSATTVDLKDHVLTLVGKDANTRVYLDNTTIASAGTINITKGHLFLHCADITAPEGTKLVVGTNAVIEGSGRSISVSELEYNGTKTAGFEAPTMVTATRKLSGTGTIPNLTLADGVEVQGSITVLTAATLSGTIKLMEDSATLKVPTAIDNWKSKVLSGIDTKKVSCNEDTKVFSLFTPVARIGEGESAQYFATLKDAIDAAGDANLNQITVLDPTAAVPQGYRVNGGKVMTAAKYYEHWKVNPGVLSWVTGAADLASNNAKLKVFDITDGTDGKTEYSGATAAAGLPGYNNNVTPWHLFVKKNTYASIAPGYVLRFPGNGTTTDKAVSGAFEPFNVGGIIVEPGAVGYSFTHDSGSRSTDLGDPDNTQETWLYFAESFKIHRSGNTTLHGPINIEVAKDKVFDINSAMDRTLTLTGKLALHGEGTIKVRTLNASNATLDLRKVGSETTAFITGDSSFGNVTVNAETKIYFPENWAAGTAMKLCSGTISGPATSNAVAIRVGDEIKLATLTYADGAVSYTESTDPSAWVVPAQGGTKEISGDTNLATVILNGTGKITGSGVVTLGDVTVGTNGKLILGAGVTLSMNPISIPDYLVLEAGAKISGTAVPSLSGVNFKIADAENLQPGSYVVAEWTEFMGETSMGYGIPNLVLEGECPYDCELVCLVKKVYLKVISAAEKAAKPIKIWPVGDSITEGFNGSGNCANYRTQLAGKLWYDGHKVQMVGQNTHRSYMPSGEAAPDEWAWHSGVSAQLIWSRTDASLRAGYMEAIDAAMYQVQDVDIVTLMLGTNDIGKGDTAEHMFEGLTNIVGRICTHFPKSKVVIGTIVKYGDATKRGDYNTMIKNWIKDTNGDFYGRIFLADNDKKFGSEARDEQNRYLLYTGDNVHPTWDGHDVMSDAWLEGVEAAIAAGVDQTRDVVPEPVLGAENNVPADYRKLFKLNRKLSIDEVASYTLDGTTRVPNYTNVSSESTEHVTKIGYYMELVRKDSNDLRYVWVDMDIPAGKTVEEMLLPTAATIHQTVTGLHVHSNMGSVTNVEPNDNSVSGYLEFTPYAASQGAQSVSGAPAALWGGYDWNDTLQTSGDAGRGCMQIHRIHQKGVTGWNTAEVLFAYNNWGEGNDITGYDPTVPNQCVGEIGIGNFAQHYLTDTADRGHFGIGKQINDAIPGAGVVLGAASISLDYTTTRFSPWGDTMNAKAYRVRNLEIWTYDPTALPEAILNGEAKTFADAVAEADADDTIEIVKDVSAGDVVLEKDIKLTTINGADVAIAATFTGAHKLTKVGKGTIKLTGSNAFNAYDIQGGAVELASASALATPTLSSTKNGRLIVNGFLPTNVNHASVASLRQPAWKGTFEIKNYSRPTTDNAGIVYFQQYGNLDSVVALNGVTTTMFGSKDDGTTVNGHYDQVLGTLEIMSGGWTSTALDLSNSPAYTCKLIGNGPITVHQKNPGVVNFIGDQSGFTGSVVMGANTGHMVAFLPAGANKLHSENTTITAKKILVAENAVVGGSGTWTASAGIVVNGELTFVSQPTITGDVTGSGRLGFAKFSHVPTGVKTNLRNANWTGSLVIHGGEVNDGAMSGAYTALNDFGHVGSKIELADTMTGYFGLTTINAGDDPAGRTIQPEIVVSGTWSQSSGYSQAANKSENYCTIIRKLSGSGHINGAGGANQLYYIIDGSEFTGKLTAKAPKFVFGARIDNRVIDNGSATVFDTGIISSQMTIDSNNAVALNGVVNLPEGSALAAGDTIYSYTGTLNVGATARAAVAGTIDSRFTLKGANDNHDAVLEAVAEDAPIVVPVVPDAGVIVEPGANVTVPAGTAEAKISVKYTDANGTTTDLKTRGYVTVAVADNGAVTVAPTEAAKPEAVKIKMTLPKEGEGVGAKDKVSFTITDPIPGLFYSIVSADDPTEFDKQSGAVEDSDGVQATNSDPHTTSIDMPDAKVKYFRVRVKATK